MCSRCNETYTCPVCRSIIYKYQKARMEGRFFYHDHCYLQVVSLTSQCIMYIAYHPVLSAVKAPATFTELTQSHQMTIGIDIINVFVVTVIVVGGTVSACENT